jgi:hypothetical protein
MNFSIAGGKLPPESGWKYNSVQQFDSQLFRHRKNAGFYGVF